MHLKLILVILLLIPATAFSRVTTFRNSDEMTGDSYSGIEITSMDNKASLYFICASGKDYPRIHFSHREFITSSGNRFTLSYKIDKDEIRKNRFVARSDHKSGRLFASWGSFNPYEDRYGPAPRGFERIGKWQVRVYRGFVADFAKGNSAFVRVWDYNGKAYTYKFNLSGIVRNLSAIKGCYPQRD